MAFSQDLTPPSTVRSEPLVNGKPIEKQPLIARSGSGWAIGVALMVFGLLGWIAGAKYTLDGWIVALNFFLSWLGLPVILPNVTGWFVLGCAVIGLVYSRVEMAIWQQRNRRIVVFWVAWFLVVATDVGSTFLGVRYPPPGAGALALQVAAVPVVSFAWSVILTFIPEWLMMGGIKLFKR